MSLPGQEIPGTPAEQAAPPSGIVLLRKPAGVTSFRALDLVKLRFRTKKVGHAGTLDKFAEGLLVVLVGPYSRMTEFVCAGEKRYRGTVRFGAETSTLDPEGEVVAEAPPPSRQAIEAALPAFRGRILQAPPAFSALHVGGSRAYELALSGKPPEMRPRPVDIRSLELLTYDGRDAVIELRCGAGTYVRSLARDLALACGSRASLVALERLAIGPFRLEEAVAAEDLDPAVALRGLSPAEAAALGLGVLGLGEADASRFAGGLPLGALHWEGLPEADRSVGWREAAVFDLEGRLLGVVRSGEGGLAYRLVLRGRS